MTYLLEMPVSYRTALYYILRAIKADIDSWSFQKNMRRVDCKPENYWVNSPAYIKYKPILRKLMKVDIHIKYNPTVYETVYKALVNAESNNQDFRAEWRNSTLQERLDLVEAANQRYVKQRGLYLHPRLIPMFTTCSLITYPTSNEITVSNDNDVLVQGFTACSFQDEFDHVIGQVTSIGRLAKQVKNTVMGLPRDTGGTEYREMLDVILSLVNT